MIATEPGGNCRWSDAVFVKPGCIVQSDDILIATEPGRNCRRSDAVFVKPGRIVQWNDNLIATDPWRNAGGTMTWSVSPDVLSSGTIT